MDGMKFIMKVEPGNDITREYMTDKRVKDGLECDGYVLVGFKDGNPKFASMMNLTIENLMEYLRNDDDIASEIMQAALIANGYRDAMRVRDRHERKEARKEGLKAFAELLLGGKNGD